MPNLELTEFFSNIYKFCEWGSIETNTNFPFCSGGGSRGEYADFYIKKVSEFLKEFSNPPSVLDLGCGDFYVGSQLRPFCGNYIACDIVPELIEFNSIRYRHLDVDFRVIDCTEDDLPSADIIIIRQVFQHLTNDQILRAMGKIQNNFEFLIFTESLPTYSFEPNIDQVNQNPSRGLRLDSGVVLTSPPFNLKIKKEQTLCRVEEDKTILYQLK